MSNAACKVAINSGLLADMKLLKSRIENFEGLAKGLPSDSPLFNEAIALDNALAPMLQKSAAEYHKLTLKVAESL
jgi:hypothetical protein